MAIRMAILAAAFSLTACGSSMAQPSGQSTGPAQHGSCGPPGAQTLAQAGSARVYVTGGKVYGCSTRGRHSYMLGSSVRCIASARVAPPVAVAGDLAAYGLERCGVDTGRTGVTVRRLTDGRQLRSFAATNAVMPEAFQSVRSIAVRPSGAVAWIGVVSSIVGHRSAIEVHKADGAGPVVTLDSGSAVVAGSLRLHGGTISWKHASATRTAPLA